MYPLLEFGLFVLLLMLGGITLGAVLEREQNDKQLIAATLVVAVLFTAVRQLL